MIVVRIGLNNNFRYYERHWISNNSFYVGTPFLIRRNGKKITLAIELVLSCTKIGGIAPIVKTITYYKYLQIQ